MKYSGMLLAFFVVVAISIKSNAIEKGYKKVLGVWEFSAPGAPQPYDNGILTIKEVDKKLAGEYTIQGQAMAIPQTEYKEKTLIMNFEVENTAIILKLKLRDGVLEGAADSSNGPVTVTAKPAKQKRK